MMDFILSSNTECVSLIETTLNNLPDKNHLKFIFQVSLQFKTNSFFNKETIMFSEEGTSSIEKI